MMHTVWHVVFYSCVYKGPLLEGGYYNYRLKLLKGGYQKGSDIM